MIARKDIIQKTEPWHRVKHGKIGGTLSKGLFVKSDTLMIEILSELTEDFVLEDGGYESFEMMRGNDLEPVARERLIEYTGINFLEVGWLECEENELLGISPDGISEDEKFSCELKCPGAKKHLATLLENDIPNDNIHQCLHYFTVNPKLEKHYFVSFRPESKVKQLFVKELTRDSMVNLGTKAKPVIKTIKEWVTIAKIEASILQLQIEDKIEKLNF